ncbi:Helix-turn-helix domain-containing protein [Lachnospiraceae bacterium NE2001]|nr:Helix-turn-helix domain-containing protein [Lachnospiraceae bacterium NE2001]
MRKKESFDNRDRLIQLGLTIAALRKLKGLSQEQLAEKAGISRSFLSSIEAPGISRSFSVDILFSISDVLETSASDLLNGNIFSQEKNG